MLVAELQQVPRQQGINNCVAGAVFPLYFTGHQIQKGRTNSYVSVSDFMKYTTANLPRGSWRYWCVPTHTPVSGRRRSHCA